MKMDTIKVIDTEETELEVEVISILEDKEQKYLIYTKGEKQKSGNIVLYITKLKAKDGVYYLDNIEDDDEWKHVKSFMGKIINK